MLRAEHREDDRTVLPEGVCEPDRGHPPAPQLALEHVTIAQSLGEPGRPVGHVEPEGRGSATI
jgi:hypothetical protein